MFKIMLALHILTAVFGIGPLVHAATTAARGVRRGDAIATASSVRLLRIYSEVSLTVVILGIGVMSTTNAFTHRRTAHFADTYIWLSLVLWAVAMVLVLLVIVPTLRKATALISEEASVVTLTTRVAAAGGIVGLIFAAVVFLMVYRPGA